MTLEIEREVHVEKNGVVAKGTVGVGVPRRNQEMECWECDWIVSFHSSEPLTVFGEDALHALTLAIKQVETIVKAERSAGYESWWLEKGDDCSVQP